jgi:tRNA pseudouridine32 synthase/23S rRNA pseudouridine746 synthase
MYKLIFKNEHFIIVDKSSNVLTVPSRMGKNDERPCLGIQLELDFKTKILPVHRLDFEVSGIVMFATTPSAQRDANLWFENKLIEKTYEAITTSTEQNSFDLNKEFVWECMLMKGKKRAYEASFGKKSVTKAKLISVENNKFRWHLNPITGRSHQLRYELSRHSHPIIGDELYGSKDSYQNGIALRSFQINLFFCTNRNNYALPDEIKINGL